MVEEAARVTKTFGTRERDGTLTRLPALTPSEVAPTRLPALTPSEGTPTRLSALTPSGDQPSTQRP